MLGERLGYIFLWIGGLCEVKQYSCTVEKENMSTNCKRCGKECQGGEGNPEARLLKRSQTGYCADCAITTFLKKTEPVAMIFESLGPEALRNQTIQEQIADLLIIGKSDASIKEIDVERVIKNWDLPISKRLK